jgi:hypothetical protein
MELRQQIRNLSVQSGEEHGRAHRAGNYGAWYQLWERAGRPENREDEFWHAAQQELRNEYKSMLLRCEPITSSKAGGLIGNRQRRF